MRSGGNFLAVIEQGEIGQAALERAMTAQRLSLRHAGGEGPLILAVMPCSGDPATAKRWLEGLLTVMAQGCRTEAVVVPEADAGRQIVFLARSRGCGIIFKRADRHGMLDRIGTGTLDLQLIRHAPVQVYVARDRSFDMSGTIAVAVDPATVRRNTGERLLNLQLLREAQEMAVLTHCEVHLISAFNTVLPPVSSDVPVFVPGFLNSQDLKSACAAVLSLAQAHGIPDSRCHILEGHPADVISAGCAEIKATALFIGTAARSGLALALIGNICERLLDTVDCDVAVLTPRAGREAQS